MQYALMVPENTQFDFQNIDTKLYLALKAMLEDYKSLADSGDAGIWKAEDQTIYKAGVLALAEFELSLGPLPEWAVGRNWDYSLVPGAQLCTKDGRKTGNAHILRFGEGIPAGPVYVPTFDCITDAGSYIKNMTEKELLGMFWVGDWISDKDTLIKRFGVSGQDYGQP